jgi:hypothetical protein
MASVCHCSFDYAFFCGFNIITLSIKKLNNSDSDSSWTVAFLCVFKSWIRGTNGHYRAWSIFYERYLRVVKRRITFGRETEHPDWRTIEKAA